MLYVDEDEPDLDLSLKAMYGLNFNVQGCVRYTADDKIVYSVERYIVKHDFAKRKQKFIKLDANIKVQLMVHNSDRSLLATVEQAATGQPYVMIYDTVDYDLVRKLELPFTQDEAHVAILEFNPDSKSLVVLSSVPNDVLYLLLFDHAETVISANPKADYPGMTMEVLASNLEDIGMYAVGGKKVILFIGRNQNVLEVTMVCEMNVLPTTMVFISMDLLLVGTKSNELMLLETGEIKSRQCATEMTFLNILWEQEQYVEELASRLFVPKPEVLYDYTILCLSTFENGFLFAVFNRVYVFERITKLRFERRSIISVPIDLDYGKVMYQITHLELNSSKDDLIVVTKMPQLFTATIMSKRSVRLDRKNFDVLGPSFHNKSIYDLTVCAWKPIVMTVSRDMTIRVYNYKLNRLEMVHQLQLTVNKMELHPTGYVVAIAFIDQVRIMQLFLTELTVWKTYSLANCSFVKYSSQGHLLAVVQENVIFILSSYDMDILTHLRGHNGIVMSVAFSNDDTMLISAGADGAVYHWNIETAKRVEEVVHKTMSYHSVLVTTVEEPLFAYALTALGTIRQFRLSEIVRDIKIPSKYKGACKCFCLNRANIIMFLGTEIGEIIHLDLRTRRFNTFEFFDSTINNITFSFCGTLLFVVTSNGTLGMFALRNVKGLNAKIDRSLLKSKEIVTLRDYLEDKQEEMDNLELRIKQQQEEFSYQLSQNQVFDNQQMADVHKTYCTALEVMKERNNELEENHITTMNELALRKKDLQSFYRQLIQRVVQEFTERMLTEFTKFRNLCKASDRMQVYYEELLKWHAGKLQVQVEALEMHFKKMLDYRRNLIRQLMNELSKEKKEFCYYCITVEDELDRRVLETYLQYENKVDQEQATTLIKRGVAGLYRKKFDKLIFDIEKHFLELGIVQSEYEDNLKIVSNWTHEVDEYQKDILERDLIISGKERIVQDLQFETQELEKYKLVFSHHVAVLKYKIEPLENRIHRKRKRVQWLEGKLAAINITNLALEQEIREVKAIYIVATETLLSAREESLYARQNLYEIVHELYHITGMMNQIPNIRTRLKEMYERYVDSDREMKTNVKMDIAVQSEFYRQEGHVAMLATIERERKENKTAREHIKSLINRNLETIEEISKLRTQNQIVFEKVNKLNME